MRNESDILVEFNRGNDNSPAYWRERMLLELLIDVRSLLAKLASRG